MKKTTISVMIILVLVAGWAGYVMAQDDGKIVLNVIAEKEIEITGDNGEKIMQRVPADKVVPGDEVIYTITYTNNGDKPAENLAVTNPIPEHMRYVSGSAAGENSVITYSIDGGKSYGLPENLKVKNTEGNEESAKPENYTHIRWTLNKPVAPKTGGSVSFRAELQ